MPYDREFPWMLTWDMYDADRKLIQCRTFHKTWEEAKNKYNYTNTEESHKNLYKAICLIDTEHCEVPF